MTDTDRMAIELEITDKTQKLIEASERSSQLINDVLQLCDNYRRLLDKMALTASESIKEPYVRQ